MGHPKNIYIVLTATGTLFSKMIQCFTRAELNHASIAFDSGLQEVYSFGRKTCHNPFTAGLIRENFSHPFYRKTGCAIYKVTVSSEEYEAMHHRVQTMMQQQEVYRYHLMGLLGVLLNIEFEKENAYFCSHFVASILEESAFQPVAKPPCFVTPEDFAASLRAHKIYKGNLTYYLRSKSGSAVLPGRQAKRTYSSYTYPGGMVERV
ncbi:hypothetical protein ['Paenibacillus yunnanensis' Narsing Rao et al. 2020]|uniref:hypothetical protein n=1 Tax=Paenibacillus tengchongensis TaxID=2608684 RepID=UPI001651E2DC|nr:hypothetical protein [Paenibacillus tengchongensis]